MKPIVIGVIIVLAIIGISVFNYTQKAAEVVSNEISPQAIQDKYEWFKNAGNLSPTFYDRG